MGTKIYKQLLCFVMLLTCVFTGLAVNGNEASAAYNKEELKNANVGDYITFGNYTYRDYYYNNKIEKRNMEWCVIEKKGEKLLLLSKYIIEDRTYNRENFVIWAECTLRKWLNKKFVKKAFTKKERAMLITTEVENKNNEYYGTYGGKNTKDKVFLLSIDEVNNYFYSDDKRKIATYTNGEAGMWWLRSPGCSLAYAADVHDEGDVNEQGDAATSNSIGVRPAIWVDISDL